MNKVILLGRLVKDVSITGRDKKIGRFTLAVDDGYGEKKKTYFPQIVCFDRLAENCNNALKKGSKVLVEGKFTTSSYEKDGSTYYTSNIVALSVEFLSPKDANPAKEVTAKERPVPSFEEALASEGDDWGDEFSDIEF